MLLRGARALAWRFQPARFASSAAGSSEDPDRLLSYWRGLLDDRQRAPGSPQPGASDARQLLHTALRLRQGKAQSSLPEQLISLFMRYHRQLDRAGRVALYRGLTAGFGVQAGEVDAAVAAWQQLRQQQAGAGSAESASAGPAASPTAAASAAVGGEALNRAAERLAAAATPLYSQLWVPMSQQPGGIKFLVDMRAELLQAIRKQPSGAAPLRALSDCLRRSLAEWFSVGLLQLRRISWEGSSAALLEKVAAGEAVHSFSGWADLKGRLDAHNRRVYAFFHETLPGEPLVVLHTALTDTVARSMQQLLPPAAAGAPATGPDSSHHLRHGLHSSSSGQQGTPDWERTWEQREQQPQQPQHARHDQGVHSGPSVAVFYSISATQRGLTGVDLGNFLIKQVAHCVLSEFPSVKKLCTLSPLPGFSDWLRLQLARAAQGLPPSAPLLLAGEAAGLEAVAAGHIAGPAEQQNGQQGKAGESQQQQGQAGESQQQQQEQQERAAQLLGWALADDAWMHSSRLEAAVQAPLLRLAAHYLLRERRRGLALDPVANFHLRNGAAVLQLNWRADVSPAGLARSHGVMVNYLYELDRLQHNNRAYLVEGAVQASPAVQALLQAAE